VTGSKLLCVCEKLLSGVPWWARVSARVVAMMLQVIGTWEWSQGRGQQQNAVV